MSSTAANEKSPQVDGAVEQTQEPLICPFTLDIFAPDATAVSSAYSTSSQTPGPSINGATHTTSNNATSPPISPLSALPVAVEETLPTIRHDKVAKNKGNRKVVEIAEDVRAFIAGDLDVKRLNVIHHRMWACGRPLNARSLHTQIMNNRKIVKTEQADLHLLYYNDTILVKPLPAYLLCPTTWELFLNPRIELHKNACGFFLSYIWLIRSPLDFQIAKEKEYLLPEKLTWSKWKILVAQFLKEINADSLHQVNERYHFGELRLGRINTIYRISPGLFLDHFVRGYLYGYNRYVVFFQRNVGWVLVVLVWFSLILSAMQVGTTVKGLQDNAAFNKASYGFVIFSMVLVAALLGSVGGIFITVFFYNMVAAIRHMHRAASERAELAKNWKKKDV